MSRRTVVFAAIALMVCAPLVLLILYNYPSLRTQYLLWQLDCWRAGGAKGKAPYLKELLARNACEHLPRLVDLDAETTRFSGGWFNLGDGRRVLYVSVICEASSLPFMGSKGGGSIAYAFVFDSTGRLLGHMFDGPGLNCGFADVDADGIFEKLVTAPYKPELPREGQLAKMWVFEVHEVGTTQLRCVFRVLHGQAPRTRHHSLLSSVFTLQFINNVAEVELEQTLLVPDGSYASEVSATCRTLARFRWDSSLHTFVGPRGGPDKQWQVIVPPGESRQNAPR
jgi:hypothetical protein